MLMVIYRQEAMQCLQTHIQRWQDYACQQHHCHENWCVSGWKRWSALVAIHERGLICESRGWIGRFKQTKRITNKFSSRVRVTRRYLVRCVKQFGLMTENAISGDIKLFSIWRITINFNFAVLKGAFPEARRWKSNRLIIHPDITEFHVVLKIASAIWMNTIWVADNCWCWYART